MTKDSREKGRRRKYRPKKEVTLRNPFSGQFELDEGMPSTSPLIVDYAPRVMGGVGVHSLQDTTITVYYTCEHPPHRRIPIMHQDRLVIPRFRIPTNSIPNPTPYIIPLGHQMSIFGLSKYPRDIVKELGQCFGEMTSIDVYCDGIRINTMDPSAFDIWNKIYGEPAATTVIGLQVFFGAEVRKWTSSGPEKVVDIVCFC
jgi:hypothetical protein